jgi:hypothetical protein
MGRQAEQMWRGRPRPRGPAGLTCRLRLTVRTGEFVTGWPMPSFAGEGARATLAIDPVQSIFRA